jgi:hypothetical protein
VTLPGLKKRRSLISTYSLENSHKPFAFNRNVAAIFMVRCGSKNHDSSENRHNPFAFNGHVAAIFMARLWLERAMTYS